MHKFMTVPIRLQRTISYNADNMPLNISHAKGGNTVTTDFVYDGSGVRAKKVVGGGSTTYYFGDHFEIKDGVGINGDVVD